MNSDFEMSADDKDYKLGHEQMVKVCKILLHKINYHYQRNGQERDLLMQQMTDQVKSSEHSTKSSMEEVNQFLHTVHQDLENFLRKHKKEHTELNMKISKLSEVAHKTMDNME